MPQRQTEERERWGRGTSYNGFIDDGKSAAPTVDVKVVRIEDDLTEAPHFIKLDLQGGELEAIKGTGKFLVDVKVLYVETQLLGKENTCRYLSDSGFLVQFDKFQFGLRAELTEVPFQKLALLGIKVDRVLTPRRNGMDASPLRLKVEG